MKLLPTADALVHNMRQEAMDKLGFTFKAVRAASPRIVYAAAVGFGRHGRYAGKPAYDDVIQAASGFAGLFEMRDGTPLYAPTIAADKISGLHLAYALMAALLYRERTGKIPGYIEVPMFELMAAFSLSEHLGAATFEDERQVSATRASSPVVGGPTRPRMAGSACCPIRSATGPRCCPRSVAPMSASSPGSATRPSAAAASTISTTCWRSPCPREPPPNGSALFEQLDIPSQPVRLPGDLLKIRIWPTSASSSRTSPGRRSCARCARRSTSRTCRSSPTCRHPALGADTAAVLREAGCSEDEIANARLMPAAQRQAAVPQQHGLTDVVAPQRRTRSR